MTAPGKALAVVHELEKPPARRGKPTLDADFAGLLRLCEALVQTRFLPRAVDTAGKAAALILTGREMGLGPMASIRSLAIVDGKPVLAADLQLGIFKRAGGQAVWQRLDDQGAALWLRHPNGDEHTETFTAEDAQRAGLLGKDNWKKFPKAMYRSRAITAGLKSLGFEPLAGTYDVEELEPLTAAGRPEPLGGNAPLPSAPAAKDASAPAAGTGATVTLESPIPFGKHAGKKVGDVVPGYFRRIVASTAEDAKDTDWYRFAAAAAALRPRSPAGPASGAPETPADAEDLPAALEDEDDGGDLPF